jgi:hypothetical protein
MISNDDIRREFLAAGFEVKPGHDDLKPYVYEAARRVLMLAAAQLEAAVAAERERLIRMVEGRAQTHNGPHLLTLELNQLAAWMAGKDWHGVPPPRA